MEEQNFEGTTLLEKLAELDLVDDFFEAIDSRLDTSHPPDAPSRHRPRDDRDRAQKDGRRGRRTLTPASH